MASKYDSIYLQVIEDLKTMSMSVVEKKHKMPPGYLTVLMPKWKKAGLVSADYVAPVKFQREHVPNNPAVLDYPSALNLPITPHVASPLLNTAQPKGGSKYDVKIPQILEELKSKSQTQVEKDMGLRPNFLSCMIPRWKKKGLIAKDYVPPYTQHRVYKEPKDIPHLFLPGIDGGICSLCYRSTDNVIHTVIPSSDKTTPQAAPPAVVSNTKPVPINVRANESKRELVRLPPFDQSWTSDVKVEWLKAYTAVVGRAKTIPFKEEQH